MSAGNGEGSVGCSSPAGPPGCGAECPREALSFPCAGHIPAGAGISLAPGTNPPERVGFAVPSDAVLVSAAEMDGWKDARSG